MATTVRDDDTVIRPAWTGTAPADPVDPRLVDARLDASSDASSRARRSGMFSHTVRVMLATLVLAAIVLFAAANTDDVRPDFLFDAATVPMWTIVAGSSFAGFLLGQLLHRRR